MRPSGRTPDEMRPVGIETDVTRHAEGSCLIKCGDTHVLCTASLEDRVPPWMKNSGLGWVTAEYGMLPRATHSRMRREAKNGQSGRTQESKNDKNNRNPPSTEQINLAKEKEDPLMKYLS